MDGSLWRSEAVLRAACFCAQVVPPPPFLGELLVLVVVIGGSDCSGWEFDLSRANRDWSSDTAEFDEAGGGGGGAGREEEGAWGVKREGPIPSAGTEMPAAPRREMADWFKAVPEVEVIVEIGVGAGEDEFDRGGRRGGREGGVLLPCRGGGAGIGRELGL